MTLKKLFKANYYINKLLDDQKKREINDYMPRS